MRFVNRYLIAVVMTVAACQCASASVISTFDTDLDGWTLPNALDATFAWQSTGGNPGGYARFVDALQNNGGFIRAPGKFLGDWSGFESISFEHNQIAAGTANRFVPYEILISGAGGSARFTQTHPGTIGSWISVDAPLVESSWTLQSGTWAGLLSNVSQLDIRIEVLDNFSTLGDTAGIDNVVLQSSVAAVPEPTTFTIFGFGALGFAAATVRRRNKAA